MERRGGGLVQRYSLAPLSGRTQREPLGTGVTVGAAPPVHCTLAGWSKRARLSSSVKLRCLGHVFRTHTLPSRCSQTLPSVRASPKSTTLFELLRCWPYQAVGSKVGEIGFSGERDQRAGVGQGAAPRGECAASHRPALAGARGCRRRPHRTGRSASHNRHRREWTGVTHSTGRR